MPDPSFVVCNFCAMRRTGLYNAGIKSMMDNNNLSGFFLIHIFELLTDYEGWRLSEDLAVSTSHIGFCAGFVTNIVIAFPFFSY